MPTSPSRLTRVATSVEREDIAAMAAGMHGFVSADLAALVDEASLCALRRVVASNGKDTEPVIIHADMKYVIRRCPTRTNQRARDVWFCGNDGAQQGMRVLPSVGGQERMCAQVLYAK